MLDSTFLDGGGGAAPDTSSAPAESSAQGVAESATVDIGGNANSSASPSVTAGDTTGAAAATQAAPAPIDTQKQDLALSQPDNRQPRQTDPDAEEAEPGNVEEQLRQYANDQNAPQFARKKIEEAMRWAGSLRAERDALRTERDELSSRYTAYEGKTPLPEADVQRMRQAEDTLFKLQSFTATPDELDGVLANLNPRVYGEYRKHLVLSAMEQPDGSPNVENIQVLVDRVTGYAGRDGEARVSAKDVLSAIDALRNGTITQEQFHEFGSEAEYEAFRRTQARERELAEQSRMLSQNAREYERQSRETEVKAIGGEIQSRLESDVKHLMQRFKLEPSADPNAEPKFATEFKQDLMEKVTHLIQTAHTRIREIGEIDKAVRQLQEPAGIAGAEAIREIHAFRSSPMFAQHLDKGLSELMQQIEKTVTREAYRYKLMSIGYQQEEASRSRTARPVLGAPNQTANLPQMTADELQRMSARDRNDHVAANISAQIREVLNPGVNRLGG